jgi:excisionase family DNA binding protein
MAYDGVMNESTEWITRKQACALIGCSMRTIDHMFSDGRLTKHVDGLGRVRINPDEVTILITPVPVVLSANR